MTSYKQLLDRTPNIISQDNIDFKDGLNDIFFTETVISSFFLGSQTKKIYIFFSAIGVSGKKYPIFNRISWSNSFDGIKIYFDDPTRNEINFAPCFYFGKKDKNYLEYFIYIIKCIQKKYDIKNENLHFISSSNGGFASLYLCNKFRDSKCIVFCPQFDIILYLKKKIHILNKKLSIDLNDDEFQDRRQVYNIINNSDSKFIIYSNIACESDKEQIEAFCKKNDLQYKCGLQKIKNFYLILAEINSNSPHLVQPDEEFCFFLDNIENYSISDASKIVDKFIFLLKSES